MGNINGVIQTHKTNGWGFTSYKINGQWWGADAKGGPKASEGESVTFDGFDKPSKDGGRSFPTIKLATFRKVTNPSGSDSLGAAAGSVSSVGTPNGYSARSNAQQAYGSRDTYWADKAKSDEAKDPRIAYFAASERAIQFVDLALRNGAFIKDKAWDKVKQTDKLQVLEAFVDEQTTRIMRGSYAATVPDTSVPPSERTDADKAGDPDESWD